MIEGDLADEFGVSKTPIREALRLLVQDGWIEVMPRRGYLVRPIGLDDLREVYELTANSRSLASSTGSSRRSTRRWLRHLRHVSSMIRQPPASSLEVSIDASRDFHLSLAQHSGNERLVKSLAALLDEVERLLRMLPELVTLMTSTSEIEAHRRIVDAP